jgi:hypothetical protein
VLIFEWKRKRRDFAPKRGEEWMEEGETQDLRLKGASEE